LGVHAAGIVIADKPLRNYVPVQFQRRTGSEAGEYLTSFDKVEVEALGLLKLDILGIDVLRYIQRCIDLVRIRTGVEVDPEEWAELDDLECYKNFASGHTELVWQMNKGGARDLLRRLRPDCFDHLVAATALIRPGPQNAGITDEYVKRRHGGKTESLHPMLDDILVRTYGLMVFQEDVIRIVHDIGGFSWAEADRIRKDIGKKKGVEYLRRTYLERFSDGAAGHGIDRATAGKIWDQIAEFGQYGFNIAHSSGYSLLSYYTMRLKLLYPLEFMCAALESESDNAKKRLYIREAQRLGITVTAPSVNVSGISFAIDPDEPMTIRAGLSDVKGVGEKTVEKIVAGAPYVSLRDFILRSGANRTAIVAFLRIGVLDSLTDYPKHIESNIADILKVKTKKKKVLVDKYWKELIQDGKLSSGSVTLYSVKERDKSLLDLLSLPLSTDSIHDAVSWLTKNCGHLAFHKIERFDSLYDGDFSAIHRAFVGLVADVKEYQDKNGYGKKSISVSLEDDTGNLQVRLGSAQLDGLDLSVGRTWAVAGSRSTAGKMQASAVWDLTAVMGGDATGQPVLFSSDQFHGFREFLRGREKLKTFETGKGSFRIGGQVFSAEEKITKKGTKLGIVCVLDYNGDMREFVIWPSDFDRYFQKIDTEQLYIFSLRSKVADGKRSYYLNTGSGSNPIMAFERYWAANCNGND
jgi:DNA polymerase III alpha subunit